MSIQLKRVCILLRTQHPEATVDFYTKIKGFTAQADPLLNSRSVSVVIEPFDSAQAGFVFVEQKEIGTNEIRDPDERPIQFFSPECDLLDRSISFSSNVMAILRSPSTEITKNFYSKYGKCQEEHHDQETRHYSIDWEGPFTEIYPQRKTNPRLVEFRFPVKDLSLAFKSIKEYRFGVHTFDNSHILISDPDDRPVRLVKD